jgi:hypothetical protein
MSAELNHSLNVTYVIAASVTTTTLELISYCMTDVQVFNKIIKFYRL